MSSSPSVEPQKMSNRTILIGSFVVFCVVCVIMAVGVSLTQPTTDPKTGQVTKASNPALGYFLILLPILILSASYWKWDWFKQMLNIK